MPIWTRNRTSLSKDRSLLNLFSGKRTSAAKVSLEVVPLDHELIATAHGSEPIRVEITPLEEASLDSSSLPTPVALEAVPAAFEIPAPCKKSATNPPVLEILSNDLDSPPKTPIAEVAPKKPGKWTERLQRLNSQHAKIESTASSASSEETLAPPMPRLGTFQRAAALRQSCAESLGDVTEMNRVLQDRMAALEDEHDESLQQQRRLEEKVLDLELELERAKEVQQIQPSVIAQAGHLDQGSSTPGAISRTVKALNMVVKHLASSLARSLEYQSQRDSNELVHACQQASNYVGTDVVRMLRSSRHTQSFPLLKSALQACTSLIVAWAVSSWTFDATPIEDFLKDLTAHIAQADPERSAKWRTMTRSHVRHLLGTEEDIIRCVASDINAGLISVLLASGRSESQVREAVNYTFAERVACIARMTLKLNKMVGQAMFPDEFEVTIIPAGREFDREQMSSGGFEDSGSDPRDHQVLCTTELGLKKMSKKTGDEQVLLTPQVALVRSNISY